MKAMANSGNLPGEQAGQLWESLLNQVQIDFYTSRLHRCAPDWRVVPRVIRDEMLHIIHAGVVRWRIGTEWFESPPGSVVFCPPDIEWESDRVSVELIEMTIIHFDAYFPGRQRYLKALGYPYRIEPTNFKRVMSLGRALNRSFAAPELGHPLKERALLYDLFHEMFNQRGQAEVMSEQGRQALQIVEYLRDNFSDEITRETLARRFHLSSGHLAVIFKEYTGESPMGYLLRLRMQRASELLAVTSLPVAEIAHAVGHGDAAYFSRIFKQQAGVSPLQYRKEQQQHS